MSETVYIKTDKNIEVSKRMVLIGDVADIYCSDKKMENDIKHICLIILDEVGVNKIKKKRVCLSFMDIVKAVAKKYPDADVNNLGENDFIVDYILEKKHSKFLQGLLIAFVAAFTFVGSMYAIMAYNNDVSTIEILRIMLYPPALSMNWKFWYKLESKFKLKLLLYNFFVISCFNLKFMFIRQIPRISYFLKQ